MSEDTEIGNSAVPEKDAIPDSGDTSAAETLPVQAEQTDITDVTDAEEPIRGEDRVFGMPRICFRGTALGVAAGMILCGLFGMITKIDTSATIWAIVCGGLGYLGTSFFYKKHKAEQDALSEQNDSSNPN